MRLAAVGSRLPRWLRRLLRRSELVWRWRDRALGEPRGDAPAPGTLRPVVYAPTWLVWSRMQQRPQAILRALVDAGHPAWFVDATVPEAFEQDGVRVVPHLEPVPRRGVLLYLHFAPARRFVGLFDEPVVVYDVLDDLSIYAPDERGLPGTRRVRSHHEALMSEADVVMASSEILRQRHIGERDDLLLVENGVDPTRFAIQRDRPPDLPEGPIVGYHGAISSWFDVNLVADVARARPTWHFVLVGPSDIDTSQLQSIANLHLLGERPAEAIPAYVQAFDVGIVPFVMSSLTEAVSPLKVYEYLAAGVPVVSVPLPACRDLPEVRLASSAEDFESEIEAALNRSTGDSTVAARSAAEAASWSRRIRPLLARLDEAELRRVPE